MTKKGERLEALVRIAVLLISGIVLRIWAILAFVIMFINWIVALVTGKRNKSLAEFTEYWSSCTYEFFRYLSGMTNRRPFPFGRLRKLSKFEN